MLFCYLMLSFPQKQKLWNNVTNNVSHFFLLRTEIINFSSFSKKRNSVPTFQTSSFVPFRESRASSDCQRDERKLCRVLVPSAIHAPLTGLFFIATAPERSTRAARWFSFGGHAELWNGEKGSVLGKSGQRGTRGSLGKLESSPSATVSRDKVGGDTGGE